MISFVDIKKQHLAYQAEIDQAIQAVLQSSQFFGGSAVALLEQNLSSRSGAHAITCANGSDALYIALKAAGVQPGDEVITTPFSFFSTASMITLAGATPIFVDIDEQSFTIDPQKVAMAITQKTKAIIPVSLFGQPADMTPIMALSQQLSIPVIEDAAQSFGASQHGIASTNLSQFATTSFYPSKPLGCYGNGGAVFCQDLEKAEYIRLFCNHGQTGPYQHDHLGINSRLDAIQAAILNVKLGYFDSEITRRQEIAARYTHALSEAPLIKPTLITGNSSVWAQYTLRSPKRDAICSALRQRGVPTAVHYPKPIHLQLPFANKIRPAEHFPVTEKMCKEVFSVPMSAFLSELDQEQILSHILDITSAL